MAFYFQLFIAMFLKLAYRRELNVFSSLMVTEIDKLHSEIYMPIVFNETNMPPNTCSACTNV